MGHVYGPVPSRRLGLVLGIDPVPSKTCNWNCVYCQLGRTAPLTNERRALAPVDGVLAEARAALASPASRAVRGFSIAGSGEPTLHSGLGDIVRGLGALSLPVAVVTNGALLHRADVRRDLLAADSVHPTLSSGNPSTFRALHRPWPGLTLDRLVEGLLAFRAEYGGRLVVEVMLVAGVNDSVRCLTELAELIERIAPDAVEVNVPARPPAEAWVEGPPARSLARVAQQLGEAARFLSRALPPPRLTPERLVEVLQRHPLPEAEVLDALGTGRPAVDALAALAASGAVRPVVRRGTTFWTASRAPYAEAEPT